jgi:AcrR family transcriptional regulator
MKKDKADKRLPASERRQVILDAATSTFVKCGYHGAHMDAIAARAGVTKPILYRHFPSKLSLLLSIVDRAGEELLASFSRSRDENVDWITSIRLDVKAYLDFVENYGVGYILIYSYGLSIDQEVSERIARIRSGYSNLAAERLRYYIDTDAVPPEDIDMIVTMIVGMSEAAAILWMSSEDMDREVCENNLVRGIAGIMTRLPPRKLK